MKRSVFISICYLTLLHAFSYSQSVNLGLGLQLFKNIEQIEYCVALPLSEYKENGDVERAHHSFVHKKNKKSTIEIRGYFCEDKKMTLEKLCNHTYTVEDEPRGKIVTKKVISNADNCFYAIGYYNNYIYQYEFLEITWVRNDEVIALKINYSLKDKALWQKRLEIILKKASCI